MEDKQKAKDRILYLLKMQGASSAADLAEQIEVSPMAIRQHLQALQAEGMVSYEEQRRPLGRPVKLWQLTERAIGLFPDSHAELMVDFLESFDAIFGEEALEKVLGERTKRQIETYGEQLATETPRDRSESLPTRLARQVQHLAQLRTREGYMAEAIAQPDGSWLFVENHCPIRDAAHACRFLCRSEFEVLRTLLGPHVKIERVEHIIQGDRRCAYQIRVNG